MWGVLGGSLLSSNNVASVCVERYLTMVAFTDFTEYKFPWICEWLWHYLSILKMLKQTKARRQNHTWDGKLEKICFKPSDYTLNCNHSSGLSCPTWILGIQYWARTLSFNNKQIAVVVEPCDAWLNWSSENMLSVSLPKGSCRCLSNNPPFDSFQSRQRLPENKEWKENRATNCSNRQTHSKF